MMRDDGLQLGGTRRDVLFLGGIAHGATFEHFGDKPEWFFVARPPAETETYRPMILDVRGEIAWFGIHVAAAQVLHSPRVLGEILVQLKLGWKIVPSGRLTWWDAVLRVDGTWFNPSPSEEELVRALGRRPECNLVAESFPCVLRQEGVKAPGSLPGESLPGCCG